ncbi:MAG: hypothetical protein R3C31_15680 [Hyphomonadaceae bacterium]
MTRMRFRLSLLVSFLRWSVASISFYGVAEPGEQLEATRANVCRQRLGINDVDDKSGEDLLSGAVPELLKAPVTVGA